MIAGEDVVEKQCHADLCQGGHASAHDPHPSPHHTLCEVLSWNVQQLAYGLLIKSRGLAPPQAELIMLPFFEDQWMPQKLINGIFIKGTHWPHTQERLSLTPSSVGHALA